MHLFLAAYFEMQVITDKTNVLLVFYCIKGFQLITVRTKFLQLSIFPLYFTLPKSFKVLWNWKHNLHILEFDSGTDFEGFKMGFYDNKRNFFDDCNFLFSLHSERACWVWKEVFSPAQNSQNNFIRIRIIDVLKT